MYTYTELASIELLVYQTTIKISCHPFEKENKPMRKNTVLGCESALHRWDLEEFIDIMSLEQKHCFYITKCSKTEFIYAYYFFHWLYLLITI